MLIFSVPVSMPGWSDVKKAKRLLLEILLSAESTEADFILSAGKGCYAPILKSASITTADISACEVNDINNKFIMKHSNKPLRNFKKTP
jgi:hypothetical protein